MNLEKHFPISSLKEFGLVRKKCKICGRYFWTTDPSREVCGDHEEYSFINNPVGKKLSYEEVWRNFSKFLEKRGYTLIKRYPVVARWRDDIDFVIASIADFQPWVVEGYVDPPAKKLTVPQFCLRFNDLGNVGFTGRHYTGFVMIGQHAFVPPEEYDINAYFKDLLEWFLSISFPLEEFIFHEDTWEGGGNAGTSIEFFIRGLEVANQVYMQYKIVDGQWVELSKIKVLDMGMGQERVTWITNGSATSYDVVFKNTLSYLFSNMKKDIDLEIIQKIAPYLSKYDYEEISLNEFIKWLSNKIGKDIKDELLTLGASYSIADHARTLYIAISDGALPSNIGGGYNLRLVLRRMYDFIEKYFDIDLRELFTNVLKDWYEKELYKNMDEVLDIVTYEIEKYKKTKNKARKLLKTIDISKLDSKKLFELYTSHGITIELIKEIYPDFEPPRDFYKFLEKHRAVSKKVKAKKDIKVDVSGFPETEKAFYESWKKYNTIARYIGHKDNYLLFDKTIFYPLKGGQKYDTGWIFNLSKLSSLSKNEIDKLNLPDYVKDTLKKYAKGDKSLDSIEDLFIEVKEVYEVSKRIVHKVDKIPKWKVGEEVLQIINKERRYILSRQHTATHILTGVLRKFYGNHIWQAGAEKDVDKARLDVTHHKLPSLEEIKKIEEAVNKIILEMLPIKKFYLDRTSAEQRYGFTIYQGGAIPEVILRIVEIEGVDTEACSGTHVDNTIEVGPFKILKVERIADGLIRFEFVAGENAIKEIQKEHGILVEISKILNTTPDYSKKVLEKIVKEREFLLKTLNNLLEEIIKNNIQEGKLYLSLKSISIKDLIKYAMKYQNLLEEVYIEGKDGILSSTPIEEAKKIGKFYLKLR